MRLLLHPLLILTGSTSNAFTTTTHNNYIRFSSSWSGNHNISRRISSERITLRAASNNNDDSLATEANSGTLNDDMNKSNIEPAAEEELIGVDLRKSRSQRIIESTEAAKTGAAGAGTSTTWEAFQKADYLWSQLKNSVGFSFDGKVLSEENGAVQQFITSDGGKGNRAVWEKLATATNLDYDVVVSGGTLGIFVALSLLVKQPTMKVLVVEGGKLAGRDQEWNISMSELEDLKEIGVLTQEDIDASITTEFPACRSGFKNREVTALPDGKLPNGEMGYETVTPAVLNLGVTPRILFERVKERYIDMGGEIRELSPLRGVAVSEAKGVGLDLISRETGEEDIITTRLLLDCMGNGSPISRQQRYGKKPDGVCAVVGSCAAGYDPQTNLIGDIIYTNTEIQDKGEQGKLQYFWEAFPVGVGRSKEPGESDVKTTYMFTYMDAEKERPSLFTLMEDYWNLLPAYQPSIQDPEKDLDVIRVLFAYFPTYTDSPLKPKWSRVLAVGDASGIQSPLSFGGFGALSRHLGRISTAIVEALDNNLLHKDDLGMINAYTPNLSAAWMFQKAMSVRVGQNVDSQFVNRLLAGNFEMMDDLGMKTMKPFLQDVVRFDGLLGSLSKSFVNDPLFMPQIVNHVGIPRLVDWLGHVSMMAVYTALHNFGTPVVKPVIEQLAKDARTKYQWNRRMDAWKYGSGSDYKFDDE